MNLRKPFDSGLITAILIDNRLAPLGRKAKRMRAIAAIAEHLQHAITCRELAERVTQPGDKKILEELAKAWEKIAALQEQDLIEAKDHNRAT